jgi:hypothetical protein
MQLVTTGTSLGEKKMLLSIAENNIWCCGPQWKTRFGAVAQNGKTYLVL